MTISKRRNKGKHAEQEPPSARMPSSTTDNDEKVPESKNDNSKEQKEADSVETAQNDTSGSLHASTQSPPRVPSVRDSLVLTSAKRRGVYECDYCHSDISQVPRVQCANCPEFDVCLDCFATTDHSAAIARLKARGQVHDAVVSSTKSGVSAAAAHHDDTHGYRVADSTRYPLFPSVRAVVKPSSAPLETDATSQAQDEEDESFAPPPLKKPKLDEAKTASTALDASEESTQEQERDKPPPTASESMDTEAEKSESVTSPPEWTVLSDDNKNLWTVEEDLRLLDAIESCGMGNWADIAEAISGNGSSNKTPKRCMERYFDDFLGRYGHILPPYTLVEEDKDSDDGEQQNANDDEPEAHSDTDLARSMKRRRVEHPLVRSQSAVSTMSNVDILKKAKVVPTASLPGYDKIWPDPYLPPVAKAKLGQEVGRDLAIKAEYQFVKTIGNAASKAEADKIREEWMQANDIHGPTVFPPRPTDTAELPGAELAGYMPRRGDFDLEWDNEAESILADMEFSPNDLPQDRQLKIQVIEIYNAKLDERERRKQFLLSRNITDYRRNQQADAKLPRDERDLVRRMRLFERFHAPEEHKQFITDLLKAKRLRKEIAKLQMYRRMGIRTLAEAERYELDKSRREYHKLAQLQKENEVEKAKAAAARAAAAMESGAVISAAAGGDASPSTGAVDYESATSSSSLWKQYKTKDRTSRRSINRGNSSLSASSMPYESGESNVDSPARVENAASVEATTGGENISKTQPESTDSPEKESNGTTENSMEIEADVSKSGSKPTDASCDSQKVSGDATFDIASSQGYELLSKKEVGLCERLQLLPRHYLEIKKALIQESLTRGLLDKEGNGSHKRAIVKIDAEKRGDVIDFMVRAGWIPTVAASVEDDILHDA